MFYRIRVINDRPGKTRKLTLMIEETELCIHLKQIANSRIQAMTLKRHDQDSQPKRKLATIFNKIVKIKREISRHV